MKIPASLVIVCCLASGVAATAEKISVIAGGGSAEKDAPALECKLREPFAVEFSPAGEMLIAEMTGGNRMLKVDASGVLRVIAGLARRDIPATVALRRRRPSTAFTTSSCSRTATS